MIIEIIQLEFLKCFSHDSGTANITHTYINWKENEDVSFVKIEIFG